MHMTRTVRSGWIGGLVFFIGIGIGIGSAAAAVAQRQPVPDAQIQSRIEQRLFDAGLIGIKVAVQDGHVTLTGTVEDLSARDEAVKQAKKVRDVKDVTSELVVSQPANDQDLARSIGDVLQGSSYLTVFDEVGGTVKNGVATLTGFVTSPDKARRIVEAVSEVEGLQQVVNRIEVLPTSMFDDEIRAQVSNQIYGNAGLSRYALQAPFPIHIIVKDGEVTLVGVVSSQMDSRLAAMLAREAPGVRGVTNQLRVEK